MIPTSESDWSYDGLLSTTAEWHVTIICLFIGILTAVSKTVRGEIRDHPHYAVGSVMVGWLTVLIYEHFTDSET